LELDEGTIVTNVDSGQPMLRRFRVTVTSGRDAGASKLLGVGTLLCGSHRDVDLRLSDPRVSRRHCELSVVADGLRVRDLGSKNGLWVQGEREEEVLLRDGAAFQVGDTWLKVEAALAPLDVGEGLANFGPLVSQSPAMRRIFALLDRVARSEATVLLEGETGVGKDVLARTLHAQSARKGAPFIVFDCAAVSPNLIAGELFGHKKGAFTGAERDRAGVFEAARGGTVFLDEIGELALDLQPSLLRVLESRTVKRVGDNQHREIDVRVIAATNRDLRDEVAARRFREDLFFRLAIVRVQVPALRDRPEDVPLLVKRFLTEFGRSADEIGPGEMARLLAHRWPGNVRELRNKIEQSAALSTGVFQIQGDESLDRPTFERDELASPTQEFPQPPLEEATAMRAPRLAASASASAAGEDPLLDLPFKDARAAAIERFERAYVERLLEREGGNVSGAARTAGIDRNYLYRLMKKCGIERA
jgi:two-component system nitrogen regulation response regulator GlnG